MWRRVFSGRLKTLSLGLDSCNQWISVQMKMLGCVKKAFYCPMVRQNFIITGMQEKAESSMGDDSHIDLEDRDPHHVNQHLQVIWEEMIGEPDGIRSPECAWRLSGHCFRLSRGCCYILLSVIVAPVIALCLGFTFACLAFEHIWCIAPCLRVWRITCSATRNFWTALVQSIVRPCTDSLGYFFYNIRVLNQKLPDAQDHKDDVHIV